MIDIFRFAKVWSPVQPMKPGPPDSLPFSVRLGEEGREAGEARKQGAKEPGSKGRARFPVPEAAEGEGKANRASGLRRAPA